MANALAHETSPYLLQHRDNPVDWLPWGEEALRRALEEDRPLLVSIGYSACHWCHVMERESFEDAGHRRAHERALRVRQGRPRGAPGRRRDLHGGRPGDDRPRRLAAERLPHARAGAVLRRHLLPARARAWACRAGSRCSAPSPTPGRSRREEIREQGARMAQRLRGRRAAERRPASRWTPPRLDAAVAALRRPYDSVNGGWGGAPKFPAASVIEFLLRRGEPQMALLHAALDGLGRHLRPGRRGLRPLQRRPDLDGAALREDALRQRAARARLRARLAGERRRAAPAHRRGDARVGAARDARARGRLLQRARRRLRGRRGQVLRLGARGARGGPRRRRARRDRVVRRDAARQLRGHERARVARRRAGARGPRADPRAAAAGARAARAPGPRRQAPGLVERADDLRAGRRRRGPRPARPARRRARRGERSCSSACATPTGACCGRSTTARRA